VSYIGSLEKILEESSEKFAPEALSVELPPEWIESALEQSGRHSQRRRALPAEATLWLVLLMALQRRDSYHTLLEQIFGSLWAQRQWGNKPPCTSAFTKARDRLGVEPLRLVFEHSVERWAAATPGLTCQGRRVYALDSSTFKVPDSEENRACFGLPPASRGQAGYPQMRCAALVDARTRLVRLLKMGRYAEGELPLAQTLLPAIPQDVVVVMDRNFFAFDFLWDLHAEGRRDFLVRIKKNRRPNAAIPQNVQDQWLDYPVPQHYQKDRPDLPRVWPLRLITYQPPGGTEPIRLLTTLRDPAITWQTLSELYRERWEEETVFDEVKTHLCESATVSRPNDLRSKTPERVCQEIYGLFTLFNLLRKIMVSATQKGTNVQNDPRRISFTAALKTIRKHTLKMMAQPVAKLALLYRQALEAIARAQVPKRSERRNPREVKVKMSQYRVKHRLDPAA